MAVIVRVFGSEDISRWSEISAPWVGELVTELREVIPAAQLHVLPGRRHLRALTGALLGFLHSR